VIVPAALRRLGARASNRLEALASAMQALSVAFASDPQTVETLRAAVAAATQAKLDLEQVQDRLVHAIEGVNSLLTKATESIALVEPFDQVPAPPPAVRAKEIPA
jgi:hypothetical protein